MVLLSLPDMVASSMPDDYFSPRAYDKPEAPNPRGPLG
jgi:hypothetical protein